MGKGRDSDLVPSHLWQDANETTGSSRCPGLLSHLLGALQSPLAAKSTRNNTNAALCPGIIFCLKSLTQLVHLLSLKYRNRGAVLLSGSRQHFWKQRHEQNKECFFVLEEEEEEGWWEEGGSEENHMSRKEGII